MPKPIVIACGDHRGIGPEVTLKAVDACLRSRPDLAFVLVGDAPFLRHEAERRVLTGVLERVGFQNPAGDPPPPTAEATPSSDAAGCARAALGYLRYAAHGCLAGEFAALVTAPVSKEAILRTGVPFVGQTEFLAELAGAADVTMMLLGDDDRGRWLRIALATTHVPLRAVADTLTTAAVERTIRQSADACGALGLARRRIAVCGLNPHAGEGGLLGDEEGRLIRPAIERTRQAGADVHGPFPADTVLGQALRGQYDVVVTMYHDQGLPTLKAFAWENGVNWTLGLPFVRTSPDHGTAFDIAGRGIADPSSMIAAIRLAAELVGQGK